MMRTVKSAMIAKAYLRLGEGNTTVGFAVFFFLDNT
jgi:hypothetical protein